MAFALDALPPPIRALVTPQAGQPRADGLLLYAATDLAERHATFEVARYLPGHVLIGDDSVGQGVPVALAGPAHPVFLCALGALAEAERVPLAASLQDWMAAGSPLFS